jgi:hypothetical protein
MGTYECFYLEEDEARSHLCVFATSDADALLRAEEFLAKSPSDSMEVRQGTRLVGRVTMGTPAALIAREGPSHTQEPRD